MPSDAFFSFDVTVGGEAIPEYQHEGKTYVESNLWTTVSYQQEAKEYVDGTIECQKWPVTPYEVLVKLNPGTPPCWATLRIDGVQVGQHVLQEGKSRVFEGFKGTSGEVKEFLFALPRFARTEDDRVGEGRVPAIGTIEVEIADAIFLRTEMRHHHSAHNDNFCQANKKDCKEVTAGKYTMSTTKQGRVVRSSPLHGRNEQSKTAIWSTGKTRSLAKVHYRMGHTLKDMGLELKPYVNAKKI